MQRLQSFVDINFSAHTLNHLIKWKLRYRWYIQLRRLPQIILSKHFIKSVISIHVSINNYILYHIYK